MELQDNNKTQEIQSLFREILKREQVEIQPCDTNINLGDENRFKKLELTREQKMQVSEMFQHIPEIIATREMAKVYKISFPNGLPHTLMVLKRGGYGSAIMENGKIVGMASFVPMLGSAVIYGVFTVMSIITGQFFLAKINKELKEINNKLDDILKFLYGDKRAELLSEVSFIKYACVNYGSIMAHDRQQEATLSSIQEARKVAMKDIMFYLDDLKNKANEIKGVSDVNKMIRLADDMVKYTGQDVKLSLQLYLMCNVLEVYYGQNFEEGYLSYLEADIQECTKRYNDRMIEYYTGVITCFDKVKPNNDKKTEYEKCKKKLENAKQELSDTYNDIVGKVSEMVKSPTRSANYYLDADKNIYYEISMD